MGPITKGKTVNRNISENERNYEIIKQDFTAANMSGLEDLKENMNIIREIELKVHCLKFKIHWTQQ